MEFNKFINKLEEVNGHTGSRAKRLLSGLYPDVKTSAIISYQSPKFNHNFGTNLKTTWDEYISKLKLINIPLNIVGGSEKSFILLNISLKDARNLAGAFGQESFVFIRFGDFRKIGGGRSRTKFTSYVRRDQDGIYHKTESQSDVEDILLDNIYCFYDTFSDTDLNKLKMLKEIKNINGIKNRWTVSHRIYNLQSKYL